MAELSFLAHSRELGRERCRVVARAPLHPRAVLCRHEAREHASVVMRGHGRETAAADREHDRALCLDPPAGLRIVGTRDDLLLAVAHLQRERTLPGFGQQRLWLEPPPDFRRPMRRSGRTQCALPRWAALPTSVTNN